MKTRPNGAYWAMRSQVAELKLISRSMRRVDKNMLHVSRSHPVAIRYRPWKRPASMPMKGSAASKTKPAAERTMPARLCRVPHVGLQKLRHQHRSCKRHAANHEHHHARSSEVEIPEQPDVDDWVLLIQLPDHQRKQAHAGNHDQGNDKVGAEPVVFLTFVEQDLQSPNPQGEQGEANVVQLNPPAQSARSAMYGGSSTS